MAAYRFIRMRILANNGSDFLSMQEMEFALTPGGPDITTPQTIADSSSYYGPDYSVANLLVDNNLTDVPHGGWTASYPTGYPQWVAFDLGSPQTLDSIRILPIAFAGGETRSPKNFEIQGTPSQTWSTNDADWTTFATFNNVTDWQYGQWKTFSLAAAASGTTQLNAQPSQTGGSIRVNFPSALGTPAFTGACRDPLTGYFATAGNQIVAADSNVPVRLRSVNWFGAEGTNNVPHGLWIKSFKAIIDDMALMGFNTIRMPFSGDTFKNGAVASGVDSSLNPELFNGGVIRSVTEIWTIIMNYAKSKSMKVVLDHHRRAAGSGADGAPTDGTYTKASWIATWQNLANLFGTNDVVIGADLHNEPHDLDWPTWAGLVEECANAIHAIQPKWLIMVEGVGVTNGDSYWWGGQLMGVGTRPVVLTVPHRVVYSPHEYGQSVGTQSWLATSSTPVANYPANLNAVWQAHWGFIFEQNIAPVWIGEVGGFFGTGSDGSVKPNGTQEEQWFTRLTQYMNGDFNGDGTSELAVNKSGISFAYWAYPPLSGDTGGLVKDDWTTHEQHKLDLLAPLLTPINVGGGAARGLPLAAFSVSGGHVVTAMANNAAVGYENQLVLTVVPPIGASESATLNYFKPASGNVLIDSTNAPIASFGPLVVGNSSSSTGVWKLLGTEGQTVTVPTNSVVRYGIPGQYVQKTLSGQIVLDNNTFTDPAPGATKHADILITTPATGYTITGPNMGPVGESGTFTVAVDGLLQNGLNIVPAATGLVFSPSTVHLDNNNLVAHFTAVSTGTGSFNISFTNDQSFADPAAMTYQAVQSIVKTFGSVGDDYPTLNAAIDFANTLNPGISKLMVVLEGTANTATVNRSIVPPSTDTDYYVLIRARASASFAVLNQNSALNEGMPGLTLNIPPGSDLGVGGGVVIEGYKINITQSNGLHFRNDGGGAPIATLRKCFIIANENDAITNQAYRGTELDDCIVIRTSQHTGKFFSAAWVLRAFRTTWINKSGVGIQTVHDGGWGNGATLQDCVYSGFNDEPIGQLSGFDRLNNYVSSQVGDTNGMIIDKFGQFFQSNNNYRAGPALIGKGSLFSKSTNDILGNNRGTTPDVGAGQNTAATPLAVATVTNQPAPDGERVALSGTYSGTVQSASVMYLPNDPSDGALTMGPYPITYANGAWNVNNEDIPPGRYQTPSLAFVNDGGVSYATGGHSFEIIGIGRGPVDTGVVQAATAVIWFTPAQGEVGKDSPAFNAGVNGTNGATVRVTPSDNGGGGTFTPAFADIVNGSTVSFTYKPATVGVKTITLTNNGGLTNPPAAQFTATGSTVLSPTLDINTPTASILNGKTATLSGQCNLQGASDGALKLYVDIVNGGTQGPFAVPVIAQNFTVSRPATIGLVTYRMVATANGLSVTKSTAQVETLSLNNNVYLPL